MATQDSQIDYEDLVQGAMRGVVRQVLTNIAKTGLPGDHHFYISFNTRAPGVILSKRLREKYPEEMTVVLQHRFWELIVTEERFEVKLTFDAIPERLVIPFKAIRVFLDPSVRFGHQFEDASLGADAVEPGTPVSETAFSGGRAARPGPRAVSADNTAKPDKKRPVARAKPRTEKSADVDEDATNAETSDPAPKAKAASPGSTVKADPAPSGQSAPASPKVVSLDQFRKK